MNYADIILYDGAVFTGKDLPMASFIAIKGNRILATGYNDQWSAYKGPETKCIRLSEEQLVLPGFHDSHLHLLMSALYLNYIDLGDAKSEAEAVIKVKAFADTIPDEPWVIGLNWYHMNWPGRKLPTTKLLDIAIPDRPVFLINTEVHGAWVNSKALELCGITGDTPNPPYGEIVKFENGAPTGFLNEMAMGLAGKIALKFPLEREKQLISSLLQDYSKFGVTSVQDMRPELGYVLGQYETFAELEKENQLPVRIHSAANLLEDLDQVKRDMETYHSNLFQVCLLKQYMDGVPTTHTAMITEPYLDRPDFCGEPINDPEIIRTQILKAHKRGMSVKIHCCGDRAVTTILDFYEEAYRCYGNTGARHAVEHAEILQPNDIVRMKQLGIIASMQPEHMVIQVQRSDENPYLEKYSAAQMEQAWVFRTLLDHEITVAFGSDNPVVPVNPLTGIYRAVTRKFNDGMPENGMGPAQKISVEEALHCYTYASAYGVKREFELGTLEPGKFADLAVIDTNILICDPEQIKDTNVCMTIMDGNITYYRD